MSDLMWGADAVSECEGLDVIRRSYGRDAGDPYPAGHRFIIGCDGTIYALVAGDMGYEPTHIAIARRDIMMLVSDWPEVTVAQSEGQADGEPS